MKSIERFGWMAGVLLFAAQGLAEDQIPWVADFRDPWGGNPFQRKRSSLAVWWDALLEWLVLRKADHVVCATKTMTDLLIARRPSVPGAGAPPGRRPTRSPSGRRPARA